MDCRRPRQVVKYPNLSVYCEKKQALIPGLSAHEIPTRVWKAPFTQQGTPPTNYGSAKRVLNIIVKHLRAGQDDNRYLILDWISFLRWKV
ncbi:hypothetical protein PHMEG_00041010 [Phytophthora megakarya]|uniref:Uncharacterized protein n=1 Tax=Phytophthora megakarya TaxID=4795 RepID=A0A225UCK3_9STRA|nr:hypothetical protein PHMEG_00041010 [Phytophthora megakarya]